MSKKKLNTAILGLDDNGLKLLQAAVDTGLYEINAVTDRDPKILQNIAEKYNCRPLEDSRQIVVLKDIDVLLATTRTHQGAEHIKIAMKNKYNVLKLMPPALNFAQAAEFFAIAKKENVLFTPANSSRFSPGFNLLAEYLRTKKTKDFHLITALCHIPNQLDDVEDRWLSDPDIAGGGVLLRNCYELIDQITLHFGLPQQVYSLNTNHAPDRQQRLSITEDTAILTMKFTDTLMANMIATRTFGPPQRQLRLHSPDRFITASENSFTVCDNHGETIEHAQFDSIEKKSTAGMLEDFAQNIINPGRQETSPPPDVDLNNMAVIESAYLSARTAMPEEPARLLEMVKSAPTNWASAAKKIV